MGTKQSSLSTVHINIQPQNQTQVSRNDADQVPNQPGQSAVKSYAKPTIASSNFDSTRSLISTLKSAFRRSATSNPKCQGKAAQRRLRIEWPSSDVSAVVGTILSSAATRAGPDQEMRPRVVALLQEERSKSCCPEDPADNCVHLLGKPTLQSSTKHLNLWLDALYLRGRCQAAILEVAIMLNHRGLLHLSNMDRTIDFFWNPRGPEEHRKHGRTLVYRILRCFEYIGDLTGTKKSIALGGPFDGYWSNSVVWWLATIIARGAPDINLLCKEIESSGYLGRLNQKMLMEVVASPVNSGTAKYDELCGYTEGMPKYSPFWGFYLPHGLTSTAMVDVEEGLAVADAIADAQIHFDNIERIWIGWFRVPERKVLPASRQLEVMEKDISRLPTSRGVIMDLKNAIVHQQALDNSRRPSDSS